MTTRTTIDRRRDALLGAMIGDCLGAPFEFATCVDPADLSMTLPSVFGHQPGWGTDDTEQIVATLHCFRDPATVRDQVAAALVRWAASNPRDIGATTRQTLTMWAYGTPLSFVASIANGSLMRTPAAVVNARTLREAELAAIVGSDVTHPNGIVRSAVAAYARTLFPLLDGRMFTRRDVTYNPDALDGPTGSVRVALHTALWSMRFGGYEAGIKAVIARGGDTDTNATIAGALLGARWGVPDEYVTQLAPERVAAVDAWADAWASDHALTPVM